MTCARTGKMCGIGRVRTLKVMTFNIWKEGFRVGGDRREKIAGLIRKHAPDILCRQEGGENPFWTAFADEEGFKTFKNVEGPNSPAIFSRIKEAKVMSHRQFVYMQLRINRRTIGIYNVHLPWRVGRDHERVAVLKEVRRLIDFNSDELVCVAGDFNSRAKQEWGLPWGIEYLSRRSGHFAPIGNDGWVGATSFMEESGFIDCYRAVSSKKGYSFHPRLFELEKYPEILKKVKPLFGLELFAACVRIDYIFVNQKMAKCLKSCIIDGSREAYESSDHLPLVATFEF